jgi:hypothetical protein
MAQTPAVTVDAPERLPLDTVLAPRDQSLGALVLARDRALYTGSTVGSRARLRMKRNRVSANNQAINLSGVESG